MTDTTKQADEPEDVYDAVAAYRKNHPETKQAEPVAWMNPENGVVIDAKRKLQIGEGDGYPKFTVPLYQNQEPVAWQPIATAPKNNKRLLYLARFNDDGTIQELDYDGSWESDSESWEIPEVYFFWASANGIEEPTHWAYQDTPPPLYSADPRKLQLEAITKTLEVMYNEYENAGQNILDIDPEEILKGLTL